MPAYLLLLVAGFFELLEYVVRNFEVLGNLSDRYVFWIYAFHPMVKVFCDDFGDWWVCVFSMAIIGDALKRFDSEVVGT